MDQTHLSDSLHDFFEEKPCGNFSTKYSKVGRSMETGHNFSESSSTEENNTSINSRNNVNSELNHEGNANGDNIYNDNKEMDHTPNKEGMVIVQMDDGKPRPPRASQSEVVIPLSPEFTPPKSPSYTSCSDQTSSDYSYSDTDSAEDNITPVFSIKRIVAGSNTYLGSDGESTTPVDGPNFITRAISAGHVSDSADRFSGDDESNVSGSDDSDSGSDGSDENGSDYERETLFMHYQRANGQSVVEKVYLDITKFVEEQGDRLKPRNRPTSRTAFRQSCSEIIGLGQMKAKALQKPNSAHCVLSTDILSDQTDDGDTEHIRKPIDIPVSQCESETSQSEAEPENDGDDTKSENAICSSSDENRESGDIPQDDLKTKTYKILPGIGNVESHPVSDIERDEQDTVTDCTECSNTDGNRESVDAARDDLKTKHYKILPNIGSSEGSVQQGNRLQLQNSQIAQVSDAVPSTLTKSTVLESKHITTRKPGIPHQLRSVACYQDGKVNVSILGDQRLFSESEPPYLNITFVHRSEQPVKKQVTITDEPEVCVYKPHNQSAKARDAVNNIDKTDTKIHRHTASMTKKLLPPIRNCPRPGYHGSQNAQRATKSAAKHKNNISQNKRKILPSLKRAPQPNQFRKQKRIEKKIKTKSNNSSKEFGISMPRKIRGINYHVVDTRAQWPPFNTHIDPEASERHQKLLTLLPV